MPKFSLTEITFWNVSSLSFLLVDLASGCGQIHGGISQLILLLLLTLLSMIWEKCVEQMFKELSLTLSDNIPHSVKTICISFSAWFFRITLSFEHFTVNKVIEITSHVFLTFQVLFVMQNICISLIFMILYGDKSCKQLISRT
jgi:hypothetical protein